MGKTSAIDQDCEKNIACAKIPNSSSLPVRIIFETKRSLFTVDNYAIGCKEDAWTKAGVDLDVRLAVNANLFGRI